MLERFAELKLVCDFSHWVCICERLIDDQLDIIKLCAERCHHLLEEICDWQALRQKARFTKAYA